MRYAIFEDPRVAERDSDRISGVTSKCDDLCQLHEAVGYDQEESFPCLVLREWSQDVFRETLQRTPRGEQSQSFQMFP